jgi:hypothetical protein
MAIGSWRNPKKTKGRFLAAPGMTMDNVLREAVSGERHDAG